MCSIVILKKSENEWPLIIAANRDEMNNRKCLPPDRHWKDKPHIFAGKDLLAGGSWLGVNDNGVVAAIMNRKNSLGFIKNKKSRGEKNATILVPLVIHRTCCCPCRIYAKKRT